MTEITNCFFLKAERDSHRDGMKGLIQRSGEVWLEFGVKNTKFQKDKVNFDDDFFEIKVDGVILNATQLMADENAFCLKDLIICLWQKYQTSIVKILKGAYFLVIRDKKNQKVFVSNDWLSKRDVYYAIFDDAFFFADSWFLISSELKKSGKKIHLNKTAVEQMIERGILSAEETYAEEIHFLAPFEYIIVNIEKGEVLVEQITPAIDQCNEDYTELECIERFDQLFSEAVRLEYLKNEEYGYQQTMALSGGMDSRACLLTAIREGFKQNNCFSYSQSKSLDAEVSMKIALDNGLDYLYYPLDHANFIKYMYEAMEYNECQQSSVGSTGAMMFSKILNFENIGIVHTGLCGGELMGDLIQYNGNKGEKLLCRLGIKERRRRNCNNNIDYIRDNIRACQNFTHMMLPHCEVASPFLDEDVVEFLLQLPSEMLIRRDFYRKWMMRKIPNSYVTTYFNGPIGISPVRELLSKIKQRVTEQIIGTSKREMNPFDYWYKSNSELQEALEKKYIATITKLAAIDACKDIVSFATREWKGGCLKKCYILTALQGIEEVVQNNTR